MDVGSWLLLKGALSICKFVGYQNCARMAAMSVGKRVVKRVAMAGLESTGVLPVGLVRVAGSALGYAPAMVVFASGVVTQGVATTATFVILSQVTDYLFVVAIRTAVASGVRGAFSVVRYVLFSRNPSDSLKKLNEFKMLNELEDGWVVVEDAEQVPQIIQEYENNEKVDMESVKKHLEEVHKVASQIDPENVEYIQLKHQDEGTEEDDEGFVVVQTPSLS